MFGLFVLAVELFSRPKKESIIEEEFSFSFGRGSKAIGLSSCYYIFVIGFSRRFLSRTSFIFAFAFNLRGI